MQSLRTVSLAAMTIAVIGSSLVASSAAGTPGAREGPRPAHAPQLKTAQRKPAASPGPRQASPHVKAVSPANNGPRKEPAFDPALKFVSLLGSRYAATHAIAVDQAGNSYIGGITELFGFATTPGAFQTTCPTGTSNGSTCAFVAKIDPSGSLVYSTFLSGSSGDDVVYGIAVDSAGDAYVTGWAVSSDFPVVNAFQPTLAGDADAFVAELNPTGSALIYSSYLGGAAGTRVNTFEQVGTGIAVDAGGAAYVVGLTNASDFPTTPGAYQTSFGGGTCGSSTQPTPCDDAFITKVAPGGGSLVYSTLLGGSGNDDLWGVAVDQGGNAHVAGNTTSPNFPVLNAVQSACVPNPASPTGECVNAFVAELNQTGTGLVFSTYLGGSCADGAQGVALDPNGDITIAGITCSTDFRTANALQPSFPSTAEIPRSGFVAQFAPGGASLLYSTYLGGSGDDYAWGVGADGFGEAFVTGNTGSTDFPTFNALQPTTDGALADAFVTAFQAGGKGLIYSTYLGGGAGTSTSAVGIVVDSQGDAWVGGGSDATTFPAAMTRPEVVHRYGPPPEAVGEGSALPSATTRIAPANSRAAVGRPYLVRPEQSTSSTTAAMAAAIALVSARVHPAPATLTFEAELAGTTSAPQTLTISNPGTAPLTFSAITASDSFSVPSGGSCSTSSPVAPGGNCTVDVAFAPTVGGNLTGTLTLTDNGIGSPHSVPLSGTGQDFSFAPPSGSSTSATVAPGSTATYTLSVGGQGGLSGTVTFTCAGAPSEAKCTVSPNPATLGSSATNVTITVTTTAPSVSAPRGPNGPGPIAGPLQGRLRPALQLWLVALAMLALLAVAAMSSSPRVAALLRRRRPRESGDPWIPAFAGMTSIRHASAFLALALLLLLAWAACGGGGGGTTHDPGTPAGTSTLTVTGSTGSGSATLTHNVTLTLTVT